ncbi:MAG: DUF2088 domain-containing protein [Phycisphaerales bacterium]|nr:MAG: DUF2088 domain-containing protein [Phycisphaerales bacterium]
MNITWETVSPALPPQPGAAGDVLRQALSASGKLGGLLQSAAQADEHILLLVNDPHRATQTRPALVALARLIVESAVWTNALARVPRFRAIVATGTHHFPAPEHRAFEEATFAGCGLDIEEIAWHDATDAGSLAQVAGVRMHHWVAESRFLLPIGSLEPHYFAGLTGPHKTVTIGCMSADDIGRNHEGALSPSSDILRLQGNPVFDSAIQILRRLESTGKTICALGEVTCGGALLAAAAGDPIEVIDALLPTVRRIYVRPVPSPVDILRLRVPLPLGRNLYQADKGLKNNHPAVRDGGGIILEADCPEGIGPDAFLNLLRRAGDYDSAQRIMAEEGYRLGDHKAVKLRHLTDPRCRGVHVALVSPHLANADLAGTGIEVFPGPQPALDWLTAVVTGLQKRGLIIHDAGMVMVRPATP